MRVVAISGFKGSGKDVCAGYLVENGFIRTAFADILKDMASSEYGIPRNHCDNPKLKENPILTLPVTPKDDFSLNIAKMLFGEFRTQEGHQASEYYIDNSGTFLGIIGRDGPKQLYWTTRSILILKGSTNRAIDSAYWVQRTIKEIDNIRNNAPFTSTETGKIVKTGDVVISDLRYRSEVEQLRQAFGKDLVTVRINRFDSINSTDASERDLDNFRFDIVIDNVGTLEELYYKLDMEILNVTT